MADHIKIYAVKPKVQYVGNGITTEYPYQFPIFDETNMEVYFGSNLIEEGYVVNGAGETAGGTIVFDEPPEEGVIITIVRNIPIERVTDFQEGGAFRPKNLNDEFDRQTAFLQQVEEALDRSLKVSVTSSADPSAIIPLVEQLYDDLPNIDTVAQNIEDVKDVSQNMEVVLSVPELTVEAQGAATEAQQYSQSAQNSSTQAENYATAANESKISAEASAQEAQQYADLNKRIIGEIIKVACSSTHIPNGCLPCDGQEYAKSQFSDLWTNFLTSSPAKLNVCTYEQYQSDISSKGFCDKIAIDEDEETFKVPTLNNTTYQGSQSTFAVKGNGFSLGVTNGTLSGSWLNHYASENIQYSVGVGPANLTPGTVTSDFVGLRVDHQAIGLITDASKSGIIAENNTKEATSLRYFIIVSNGQINQAQMDWSAWASSLNGKMNKDFSNSTKPYLKTTYLNGTSGYRIWSDGYCEQWGLAQGGQNAQVDLLKTYSNTNYNIIVSLTNTTTTSGFDAYGWGSHSQTVNSFKIFGYSTGAYNAKKYWKTSGYLPEGGY